MTDRAVRAAVYAAIIDGEDPTPAAIARRIGRPISEARAALERLADAHRVVLGDDGTVRMAHPFSTVPTGYTATVEGRT